MTNFPLLTTTTTIHQLMMTTLLWWWSLFVFIDDWKLEKNSIHKWLIPAKKEHSCSNIANLINSFIHWKITSIYLFISNINKKIDLEPEKNYCYLKVLPNCVIFLVFGKVPSLAYSKNIQISFSFSKQKYIFFRIFKHIFH